MAPKFSIVIPTYNREGLLRRTVESALAQEGFDDYEVVVVDDCSPDGTWSYLQGVEDPKLRILRNDPRLGMGPNWNKAVRSSAGEYVFILQDDDLAKPQLMSRAAALAEKYPSAGLLCFSTCYMHGEEESLELLWEPEREELLPPPEALMRFARYWTLSSTQVIFSRRVFDEHGGFDLTPPIMSDAEAILRWMLYAQTLVVPEVVALRRQWGGSVTSATQHSEEMVETMHFLADRIEQLAAESPHFDAARLEELRALLRRSFRELVQPPPAPAPAAPSGLRRLWAGLNRRIGRRV